ncbi:MAG: GDSL-type esterase/lipase family protein [Eubacteriales bacterium]|nr:GDSL-type esterase/lipase family protein [Eubacteriales bacterium]
MKQLLCFGDSNTWGLIPNTKERYSWGVRWTSILQQKLQNVRVLEEGLCGRTTIFDDAYRKNRNGLESLPEILESSYPLDAAIIMLGTNDCKSYYNSNSFKIAKGLGLCIDELSKYISPEKILVVSPIFLGENVWKEEYDPEFDTRSVETAKKLYSEYKKVALEKGTNIISAADYVQPSEADQEHLTAQGHKILANAILNAVLSASLV